MTLHYLEVHKILGELNSFWKAGKYYETGFNGAILGHKALGSSGKFVEVASSKDSMQQGLNGLF